MEDNPGEIRVHFEADARIDVRLDIVGFYRNMTEWDWECFISWADVDFWDGEAWTKPIDYLIWTIDQNIDLDGVCPGKFYLRDLSTVDNWKTPRRVSTFKTWTEADYADLLAAVPRLAEVKVYEELDVEERGYGPGPLDVPLFDVLGPAHPESTN